MGQDGLTDRERGVLHDLQAGKSQTEIAKALGVSRQTVSQTVARLRGKGLWK